nr:EOG090X0JAK [Artemia franciscana]
MSITYLGLVLIFPTKFLFWLSSESDLKIGIWVSKDRPPRDFGYEEKLLQEGLLPRLKDGGPVKNLPDFKPKDRWSQKRAVFGQNDYIDILGSGNLRPIDIMYGVPYWLRGLKDNREYQTLIRKRVVYGLSGYSTQYPTKWEKMQKRISYLYRFINNYQKQDVGWKGQ